MDSPGAIARPYARAAFAHAKDRSGLAQWSAALKAAAAAVADPSVRAALESSETSEAATELLCQSLEDPAAWEFDGVRNLMRLLRENRRMGALGAIAEQFEQLWREDSRRVEAVLVSAAPLDVEQQDAIARALKARLGREVDFRFELDENLLGGVRVQVGDQVLDGSARSGLSTLAAALSRPGNQAK